MNEIKAYAFTNQAAGVFRGKEMQQIVLQQHKNPTDCSVRDI